MSTSLKPQNAHSCTYTLACENMAKEISCFHSIPPQRLLLMNELMHSCALMNVGVYGLKLVENLMLILNLQGEHYAANGDECKF